MQELDFVSWSVKEKNNQSGQNFRTKCGRNSDLTSSSVKGLIRNYRRTESISDLK